MEIIAGSLALADVTMDDRVRVFLLTVVRRFLSGLLARFKVDSLIILLVLEVVKTLLGLQFKITLPVLVAGVRTSLTTGNKVSHRVKVGRLFRLKRRETPVFGWVRVTHGRHAWVDTRNFGLGFYCKFSTKIDLLLFVHLKK